MFKECLTCFIILFVIVSSSPPQGRVFLANHNRQERKIQDVSDTPLQQAVVIQMHYDCQGRLVRQESSKLKVITGLILVPGEEDTSLKVNEKLMPLPLAFGREDNEIRNFDSGTSSGPHTEAPYFIKSNRKRVRIGPSTSRTLPTRAPEDRTTLRTPQGEGTTRRSKLIVDPDRIIDVPIRACPPGENEDIAGRCRPVFPEH